MMLAPAGTKPRLLHNRDFLAGLLFMVFGVLTIFFARHYPIGITARMGPGYFPMVLGGLLCLFGLVVMLRGLRSGEPVRGTWGWRPLALITLSIVIFGFSMEKLGLVPALILLFFIAAFAGREFRFKEVLLLAVLMSAFAAAVFVYGLKLPYPLFGSY
jgi:Tripartite tricarboxylate transporter TctB family